VGPIGRVEDRDVRHPWVLFITGVTCVPSEFRRGAPSRDRSWRSPVADSDAGRTGIRQHSTFLFHIMGHSGYLGMACYCPRSYRGVRVMSGVVRSSMAPLVCARLSPEGLFA
jgi:hypothetical protein